MTRFGCNTIAARTAANPLILTWDASGDPPLNDGPGTWNLTGTNWARAGGGTYGPWINGAIARIGWLNPAGVSTNVTVSNAAGAVKIGGFSCLGSNPFGDYVYSVSGDPITSDANTVTTFCGTWGFALNAPLTGTFALTHRGAAITFGLNSANWTGPTTIFGTANVQSPMATPSVEVASGGLVYLNNSTGAPVTHTYPFSGSGTIIIQGSTYLTTLSGDNSAFTGSLRMQSLGTSTTGGGLVVPNDSCLGSGNFFSQGGASRFYYSTSGNVWSASRQINLILANHEFCWDGATGRTNTIAAVISGSGSIRKRSGELHILTGTNTYTGTTWIESNGSSSGSPDSILRVTGSGRLGGLGGSSTTAQNIVFTNNGTNAVLEFETSTQLGNCSQIRFSNTGGTVGWGGCLRYIGSTAQQVSKTLYCDTNIGIRLESNSTGSGSFSFGGAMSQTNRPLFLGGTGIGTFNSVYSGTGAVTKRGSGTWTFPIAQTYTGLTTVSGGTLISTVLYSGTANKFVRAEITATEVRLYFSSPPVIGDGFKVLSGGLDTAVRTITQYDASTNTVIPPPAGGSPGWTSSTSTYSMNAA